MPTPVDFYEGIMISAMKEVMNRNIQLFCNIEIPEEAVRTAKSFSDLSQHYAVPVEITNAFIIWSNSLFDA